MVNISPMKPALVEVPSSITVDIATAVNLSCIAQGYPPPTYQWYKDGEVVAREVKSFLYIAETLPNKRGSYLCQAYNSRGQTSSDPAVISISGISQTSCHYIMLLKKQ